MLVCRRQWVSRVLTWNGLCHGQSSFPAGRIGRINGIRILE
jgi:hypothetical protein